MKKTDDDLFVEDSEEEDEYPSLNDEDLNEGGDSVGEEDDDSPEKGGEEDEYE